MTVIDPAIVGLEIEPFSRRLDVRDSMKHAAAVGDANLRYLDDARPGGVVAHPLFAVVLTWPVMTGLSERLGDRLPPEAVLSMVHAGEHLIFHEPMRPGDDIRITGRVAAVSPVSAGTLLVLCLEAAGKNGPLFTEYATALFRGVACRGEGRGRETLPASAPKPAAKSGPGETVLDERVFIPPEAAHLYDGCTDIIFPIHTSNAFARAVGLPGVIYQGTATLARAATAFCNGVLGGDPARLKEIACRFSGFVSPGSTLRVHARGLSPDSTAEDQDYGFSVYREDGAEALGRGFVRAR